MFPPGVHFETKDDFPKDNRVRKVSSNIINVLGEEHSKMAHACYASLPCAAFALFWLRVSAAAGSTSSQGGVLAFNQACGYLATAQSHFD